MNLRLLFFALLLLPLRLLAQSSDKHTLTGYCIIPGDAPMSYLVSFTINGSNVSGYSITDYKSGNTLKASVIGKLDANGNLYIKEMESLDEKPGGLMSMGYCFFTGALKLSMRNGRKVYSGPFTSRSTSNTPCGGGTMTLTDVTPPKPAAIVVKPTVVKPPSVKPSNTIKPLPPDRKPDTIAVVVPPPPKRDTVAAIAPPKKAPVSDADTLPVTPLYLWDGDSVVVEIWDGYKEDGDVVSVSVDGENILSHYNLLTNGKRRLAFYLPDYKTHTLQIDLFDMGSEPPNTPDLRFTDGVKTYRLDVEGKYGEVAKIYFRRKKR